MSNTRPAWRRAPLGALFLSVSLLSFGLGQTARADTPVRHTNTVISMPPAPNHAGTALVAHGRQARLSKAHTNNGWADFDLSTDNNGTSYSLWGYLPNGAAGEWIYDASGVDQTIGPVYGPYADSNGTWGPYAISVNPTNGRAKILWTRSDGAAGVWTMDDQGNASVIGPTYGPYPDWQCIGITTQNDGTATLLWERNDGAMAEWILDHNGNETELGTIYGPYSDSNGTWAPVAIGTNPSDFTSRIVWERSDFVVGFWTMDENGTVTGGQGMTYGPFSNNGSNWNPQAVATANDGTSSVLWARDDGAGVIWQLDPNVNVTGVGPTYGPYVDSSGTWSPGYEGAGLGENPNDDTTRVMWNRSDGATGIWALDPTGTDTSIGPVYGPYD